MATTKYHHIATVEQVDNLPRYSGYSGLPLTAFCDDYNGNRMRPVTIQDDCIDEPCVDSNEGDRRKKKREKKVKKRKEMTSPSMNASVSASAAVDEASNYKDFSRVPPTETNSVASIFRAASAKEPTFPVKLHLILSNPDYEDIISWMPHGRSWRILKPDLFEDRVLPFFFCHCRLSSFMRQVNGWGFRRIKHGPDYNSYYNELFLRGMPHLAERMRRESVRAKIKAKGGDKRANRKGDDDEDEPTPDLYKISEENPLPANPPPGSATAMMVPKKPITGMMHAGNHQVAASSMSVPTNPILAGLTSKKVLSQDPVVALSSSRGAQSMLPQADVGQTFCSTRMREQLTQQRVKDVNTCGGDILGARQVQTQAAIMDSQLQSLLFSKQSSLQDQLCPQTELLRLLQQQQQDETQTQLTRMLLMQEQLKQQQQGQQMMMISGAATGVNSVNQLSGLDVLRSSNQGRLELALHEQALNEHTLQLQQLWNRLPTGAVPSLPSEN